MILVDSSALVEYYRPNGTPEAQAAVTEAIEADAAIGVEPVLRSGCFPLQRGIGV
jgi:hypothetical protein